MELESSKDPWFNYSSGTGFYHHDKVWMDNMEGGLDYLKGVVIDDKLGICEELERQMQNIVDTYQCEWKTAVETPEKRKRFRHFVNSDQKDSNIVFVEEREQVRPATQDEIDNDLIVKVG